MMNAPSANVQELKKPDRNGEKYHTITGLYKNARIIQQDILSVEYVHLRIRETEQHRERMHEKAKIFLNIYVISDEELMTRFCCGLFANPSVSLGICQQWEAVGSHLLYSGGLIGNGKIWTLLLHTLLCPPNLQVGLVPIFQQYQTMIYPFGMDTCSIMEFLLSNPSIKGLFKKTPLDVAEGDLVTCPGFLRFDVAFLPVLAGRLCLCCLRTRKCFTDISFQYGSDICYRMATLSGPTHFIYNTLFEHFRPCLVASMMVALVWAAQKRGLTFLHLLLETLKDFHYTLERIQMFIRKFLQMYPDTRCTQRGLFRKSLLHTIAERISVLGVLMRKYFRSFGEDEGDYSLRVLHMIYQEWWDMLRNGEMAVE
jgi:hypothetical protein